MGAIPMLAHDDQVINGMLQLLEESYLADTAERAKSEYSLASPCEKRVALLAFAEEQAKRSPRWADIAKHLRSAEIVPLLYVGTGDGGSDSQTEADRPVVSSPRARSGWRGSNRLGGQI
jgi:hypothetical protein